MRAIIKHKRGWLMLEVTEKDSKFSCKVLDIFINRSKAQCELVKWLKKI